MTYIKYGKVGIHFAFIDSTKRTNNNKTTEKIQTEFTSKPRGSERFS